MEDPTPAGHRELEMLPPPLTPRDLVEAWWRPSRLCRYVLGADRHLVPNLLAGQSLGHLAALLGLVSCLGAIPFGLATPELAAWKASVLLVGGVGLCFPCLQVFAEYLDLELSLTENAVLCLTMSSVAAVASIGFAPIVWFIDATTDSVSGSAIPPAILANMLLVVAMGMGLGQLARSLAALDRYGRPLRGYALLTIFWLPLLVFIMRRLGSVLGFWS